MACGKRVLSEFWAIEVSRKPSRFLTRFLKNHFNTDWNFIWHDQDQRYNGEYTDDIVKKMFSGRKSARNSAASSWVKCGNVSVFIFFWSDNPILERTCSKPLD